jgi:hypothetical protein
MQRKNKQNLGVKRKYSQYCKTSTNDSCSNKICKDRIDIFNDNLNNRKRTTHNFIKNNFISFEEAKLKFESEKENRKPQSNFNFNKNGIYTNTSINSLSSQMNKLEIKQFHGVSPLNNNFNPFTMKPTLKKNFTLSELNTEVRSNFKKSFGEIIHQKKFNKEEGNINSGVQKITGKRNFLFLTDSSISSEIFQPCQSENNILNFTPKFRDKTPDKKTHINMEYLNSPTLLCLNNLKVNITKTNFHQLKKDL